MYRLWWQLPGPNHFLATITQDLRDGLNVLFFLPQYAPRGIGGAIRSALGLHTDIDWYPLRADNQKPIDLLLSLFGVPVNQTVIRNARLLAESPKFAGKFIWLEGINETTWDLWKDFLNSYSQTCQHVAVERRTRFCIPLSGRLAKRSSLIDPLCSQYLWRGVVSNLDMVLFTSIMLQERFLPPLQRLVAVSVIARLALWDPETCERLAMLETEDLLNPIPTLREIAIERGWDSQVNNAGWETGMNDFVDGKWLEHSAILALRESDKQISRRIWSAQMTALLPIVEEIRQGIIDKYSDQLTIPWGTRFGVVRDVYDLEINHINTQITSGKATLDAATEQLVSQLTNIRNELSHLKTLTRDMLDSIVLNEFIAAHMENQLLPYLQDEHEEPAPDR